MISPYPKNIIPERWYHRLIKTFIIASSLLLLGGALMVLLPKAFYFQYAYSFDKSFSAFLGEKFSCSADANSGSIDCGNLTTETFISRYLQKKGHYFTASGTNTSDTVAMYQEKGLSNFQIAQAIMEQNKIHYKRQKVMDKKLLIRGGALSVALALAYFLLNFILFKTALYILHGHTTVARLHEEQEVPRPGKPLPPI